MENDYLNSNPKKLKRIIMSRDSFKKLVNQNDSLNNSLNKLNEKYYDNMKTIFDSDEKKIQVMSFLEKLRFKSRLTKRNISPLLKEKLGITNDQVCKTEENIREKSMDIKKNNNENKQNIPRNLKEEIFQINNNNNLSEETIKIEKNEMKQKIQNNKYYRNNIYMYSPNLIKKKENLEIAFTRINITTVKKNNKNLLVYNQNFFKENFSFSIKSKFNNKYNHKNPLKIENIDLFIDSKKEINKNFESKNFTGFKLIQLKKGNIINEIPFNKSINELNKIFEEKKIKINHNQLKFNCLNENIIDQNIKFNVLSNLNKKKIKNNLNNVGVNTIKEKKKTKEIGINVGCRLITSNSGNNTDINLTNWDSIVQNMNFDTNNLSLKNKKELKNEKMNILKHTDKYEERKISDNLSSLDKLQIK